MKDRASDEAAAQLNRLVEATALLRLYRASEGQEPRSAEAVSEWRRRQHPGPIRAMAADYAEVARSHPDLAALARRSSRFLSGNN
jgi:hypothetical protein